VTRLLADAMLGRLARWLRAIGGDTAQLPVHTRTRRSSRRSSSRVPRRSSRAALACASDGAHLGERISAGLTSSEGAMHFQLDDSVRVVRLLEPEREVTGSSDPAPQPRVGDRATVVADLGDGLYLLESCTDDGMTVWMGEFAAEELTLVERPDNG
jgi:hypothetical protein